jgi:hypothetical protein
MSEPCGSAGAGFRSSGALRAGAADFWEIRGADRRTNGPLESSPRFDCPVTQSRADGPNQSDPDAALSMLRRKKSMFEL